MLDKLRIDDFRPRLNERFVIRPSHVEEIDTELVQVTDLGEIVPRGRRAFSLVFRGPKDPVLPQRVYPIENGAMGRLEMFIVPIGPDGEGMRYEAVFT